ncbi:MAG: hypothetical protein HYR93_07915 [Chloroflexi bacterium]|nr:hypothetical protein [Chloroflexota bacterium]
MKNKILFVAILIAMFTLAACGGGNQAQSTASTPASAPASVMTISKNITLDPALAADADSRSVIDYVYEGLVKLENGSAVPALASSWTVSGDGLEYIFNLRSGAAFHDGSPVNADAVIANFNRWFDPKDANRGSGKYDAWVTAFKGFKGSSTFDGAEKVNEATVILHLNTPDPDFLTKLADPAFSIVSPAALSAAGFGTSSGKDGGSGAYKLGAWTDTGLTLEPASSTATGNIEFKFGQ